jgi:TRAP-type C4-dicarboxylate transport system permease small subunit
LNGLNPRRLRLGEIVAGASAVLLLIFLFVPSWYTVNETLRQTLSNLGAQTSWNGWWGLSGLRFLVLVTIVAALALAYFQSASRAPAVPVVLSVIVTVLAGATVIALIYRVSSGPPSYGSLLDQQAGPWLGLAAAIAIAYGGYKSMREEGGTNPAMLDIETVRLQNGS